MVRAKTKRDSVAASAATGVDPFEQRERFIQKQLQISDDEWDLSARASLSRYLQEIDQALMSEPVLLFDPVEVTLTPMNIVEYTQQLIERSHAIAEMALTCSPAWSFDGLTALCADLGRLLDFGDSTFKHNFVLILRHITAAQERHDMTALADLLSFEVPALLRSLLKSYTQLNAPEGKTPASKKQTPKA